MRGSVFLLWLAKYFKRGQTNFKREAIFLGVGGKHFCGQQNLLGGFVFAWGGDGKKNVGGKKFS